MFMAAYIAIFYSYFNLNVFENGYKPQKHALHESTNLLDATRAVFGWQAVTWYTSENSSVTPRLILF